jgi:hypothetical protein
MKSNRQLVGSAIAVALFGVLMSVGASSAHAQAKKTGWWIRVNTTRTEAASISFRIGTSKHDSRNWRAWRQGYRVEFDVPVALRNAPELYLHATTNPHDKDAWFCVFYRNHGVEHFEFDGDGDHQMRQTDSGNACHP